MWKSRLLIALMVLVACSQPIAQCSEVTVVQIEKLVEYDKSSGVYKYECQDGSIIASETPFVGVKDGRPWKVKHPKITSRVVTLRHHCRWSLPILQAAGAIAQIISTCIQ